MNIAKFFIDRPIFATVLSLLIVIFGSLAYSSLPVAQYPEVAPPTIQVVASYPGASAATIADTVATPIEQQVNGVENMLYMSSQSNNDGQMILTITFKLGTDLDQAQVLVQNRVAIAEPRLPEIVKRIGVTTKKNSPDLLLVVNMFSPKKTYDQLYIANYATINIIDVLARIPGVGDARIFGGAQYSMRIWLDPQKIATYNLTVGEVVEELRRQNLQVASGKLNQLPAPTQSAFELSVQTRGRLLTKDDFENLVIKSSQNDNLVYLKDIAEVKLGAENYSTMGYLKGEPAIALPVYQRPGTNALEASKQIHEAMAVLAKDFPPDLNYDIVYNPTDFIQESIDGVKHTIFEAVILVVLVILLFLQDWRATVIPIIAIPISLIGTFAVMKGLDFSLNNLSLFGLVLAIGIVVDDAIVVVENMERELTNGKSPRQAAIDTMNEVGGALVAMGLVLVAVFLPTAFITGISGEFYKQFGITIAVATMISVFVSLSLSPALAKILLRPKDENNHSANKADTTEQLYNNNKLNEQIATGNTLALENVSYRKHKTSSKFNVLGKFFNWFNENLEKLSIWYADVLCKVVKRSTIAGIFYVGLIIFTFFVFKMVPGGFIPMQDQGYFIVAAQLPPGSSLTRTDAVVKELNQKLLALDGIRNAVGFTGFSGASFSNASNYGTIFPTLVSHEKRKELGLNYDQIFDQVNQVAASIKDAFVVVIKPPPVRGIGNAGGFKVMLEDRGNAGYAKLEQTAWMLAMSANAEPTVANTFTLFENKTPQVFLDVDYVKARKLKVNPSDINQALEVYLGSAFINDFNYLGRTYRVTAQAQASDRLNREDIDNIKVRNTDGGMVPVGSFANSEYKTSPARVVRYNLYKAADILGGAAPGKSSSEALNTIDNLSKKILPVGFKTEWTELAFQQKQAGNTGALAFGFAVVFVFLLLAAQYESWILPLAVVLIVPMCLLSAMTGVALLGMENNILTQIGLVVLVGLASKNAILIVEFAKQKEEEGLELVSAAITAAKLRLRPILMTAFSFILGVLPLVFASGAGAEMRKALGIAVFSGMTGVTLLGLIYTPVFYILCRRFGLWLTRKTYREKA